MVRFKAGASAEVETVKGRQPQQIQQQQQQAMQSASDPFDAWDSVLGGPAAATAEPSFNGHEEYHTASSGTMAGRQPAGELPAVTVTELPPVAVEPLPAVEGGKCVVVELEAEGGLDRLQAKDEMLEKEAEELRTLMYEADNAAASVIASIENEAASILGIDLPVEPTAIAAAKLAYLQAALRLSAMEVKIGRLDVEIADLEGQLEEAKEKRETLQEAAEPQHEAVLELYNELAKLLPADELAAYEEAIESGEVALPAGSSGSDDGYHTASSGTMDGREGGEAGSGTASPPPADDSWKLRPTSELAFSTVKGCGPKKIEAILDRCPTMGEFETLRADFYNGGLKQIPGVGEKLAGELENLALEWLTKNRDAAVMRAAATAEAKTEDVISVEPAIPPVAQLEISGVSGDQATGGDCKADIRQSPAVDTSPEPADGGGGIGDTLALDVVVEGEEGEEVAGGEEASEAEDEPVENPEPDEETPLTSEEEAQLADNKRAYDELVTIFREKGAKALTPPPQWSTYFERGQSDFADGYPGYDCIYTGGDMRTFWMAGHVVAAAEAGVLQS